MKLKLTLVIFSSLLILAACKKDKNDNPAPQPTNKELIVGKKWKLTGAKAFFIDSIDVFTDPDLSSDIECIKDDIIIYKSDGTYTLNNGGTACEEPIPTSGTWELSSDQKVLTTDKGTDDERVLNLTSVTATTMKANTTYNLDQDGFSFSIPLSGTFTAQ